LSKTAVAVNFVAWLLTAGLRGVIVTLLSLIAPGKEEIVAWEPRLLVHVVEAKNTKKEKTTITLILQPPSEIPNPLDEHGFSLRLILDISHPADRVNADVF